LYLLFLPSRYKNFKLPGLDNYTPEQLFFISYGRLWCTMMTPGALVDYIGSNPHSPGKWRIIGAVQNSPDFAKAFKCKSGSPMNPVKKCEVW
jgi:endothelin-converting enzyme